MNDILDIKVLASLEPISSFSPARLVELLDYCRVEDFPAGSAPMENMALTGRSVYLLRGEMDIEFADGNKVTMRENSEWSRHPIGKRQPPIVRSHANRRVQLLSVEDDFLDRMITWDQLTRPDEIRHSVEKEAHTSTVRRLLNSGLFSADHLHRGPFAHLPPANVGKLLDRIEAIVVWDKEIIIREGDEGDYYYLIESGRAQVTRMVGGTSMVLAELQPGDAFGEEALISNGRRNATVTMKSNGVLLRLSKQDFQELLQEPLLHRISFAEAKQKVASGAVWLDVRHPPEYRFDKLPGAMNVPLNDIRNAIGVLNKNVPYIAYCQTGRRSAAAAFILAQAGYTVDVLENGLWSIPRTNQQ